MQESSNFRFPSTRIVKYVNSLALHLNQRKRLIGMQALHQLEATVVNRNSLVRPSLVGAVMCMAVKYSADVKHVDCFGQARRAKKRKDLRRFAEQCSDDGGIVQHNDCSRRIEF